tara:strand:- start:2961 stop:3155 length:195 start_codon:yes stop_codon:yes gene_type:complete
MRKITINIFLNQNNTCELKSKDQCEREKIITKNLASIELEDFEEEKRRFKDFEEDVLKKGKKDD